MPEPLRQALLLRVLLPSTEECAERECARLDRDVRFPGVRLGELPGVRVCELPSRVRVTAKLGGNAETGWLYAPSTYANGCKCQYWREGVSGPWLTY